MFVPFCFDGNQFFGAVRSVDDWLQLCEAYQCGYGQKSKRERRRKRIQLMRESVANPMTEEAEEMPWFSIRSGCINDVLTLEEWLRAKDGEMYTSLLDA